MQADSLQHIFMCDFLLGGLGLAAAGYWVSWMEVANISLFILSVRPNWAEGREWVSPVVFSGFALDWRGFLRVACAARPQCFSCPASGCENAVVTISFGTPRILRRVSTHFPGRNVGPLWGLGKIGVGKVFSAVRLYDSGSRCVGYATHGFIDYDF